MEQTQITIAALEWPSALIDVVQKLHRADSHHLGFFPRGAFEDHAREKQILIASDAECPVLGYLLYRVAKQRAIIVHLCTSAAARKRGIARALVEHLKRITKPLAGIGLHCRQDYDERHMWAKFGFAAEARKVGRSYDGHELTFFWFDHQHPDLFSIARTEDERLRVVIDANVFFDLQGRERKDCEDSKVLLADWVQDSIELCVTKEMLNEIDRAADAELHRRSRAEMTRYTMLTADDAAFQRLCDELKPLFPAGAVLRDDSDLRQVAYAIAGQAAYFVTRDGALAERGDALYERHGLQVLHPAELISRLDVLAREEEYRPARVHGSQLKGRTLTDADLDWAVNSFRDPSRERVNEFRKALLHFLSNPRDTRARIVADGQSNPVLFATQETPVTGLLTISLLRAAKHPLGSTMLRSFLRSALDEATEQERAVIEVTDACLGEDAKRALNEFGFAESQGGWVKFTTRTVGDIGALRAMLDRSPIHDGRKKAIDLARATLTQAQTADDPTALMAVEALLWPAKVSNDTLPTFIMPIRAEWAQHFFDEELAATLLLGLRDELHLGVEGAYYCSIHRHLSAPARILWYVSKGNEGIGSMCLKACSQLQEIVIGKPRDLYRRFRRLGVYEWRHVFEVADQNLDNDIMAVRFSMTERFTQPVTLDFLAALDIRQPFLSPRKVSASAFDAIYMRGFGLDAA